jgi:polar amino acid transport system substrate-binding protein
MFKLAAFLVCTCALVSVLPCYGSELWPEDIRKIKERGKLIVAQYGGEQPGFFAYDDDYEHPDQLSCVSDGRRLVGCDIFLAVRLSQALGVRLELDRTVRDFDSVCQLVAQGKADMGISMLSVTLKRAQYLRFSSPYTAVRTGVLVDRLYVSKAKAKGNVLALLNRSGTKIGVRGACSYTTFAREAFPNASFVVYHEFDPMIRGVLNGEIDAMFEDQLHIMHRLHRNPKLAVQLHFVLVPTVKDPIAIAVSPDSPNLLAFINLFLEMQHIRTAIEKLLRSLVPSVGPRIGTAPPEEIGNSTTPTDFSTQSSSHYHGRNFGFR